MPMTEESFAAAAAADNVEDAARWLVLDHGQRLRTVRRYMQALHLGREAAERFPEADQFYKKNVVPAGAYVSPGLRRTIEQGIKAFPARSREGYAQDLFTMSRFAAGPQSPCGWAPFCCGIDNKMRGLIVGLCPMDVNDPRQDRMQFATLAEVLAYATDGPEDELDQLDD
jgi:hypothetical protein